MSDLSLWEDSITDLEHMEGDFAGVPDRKRTIYHIFRALRQYAEGQFRFFFDGFGNTSPTFPSTPYPVFSGPTAPAPFSDAQVLDSINTKIKTDRTILRKAANQRQSLLDPFMPGVSPKTFLQMADCLTFSALWPDGHTPFSTHDGISYNGDFRVKTILSYFFDSAQEDLLKVRIIPYAQVAMVGIPDDTPSNLRKLLAIPHEVGHFLFWYSYCEDFSTGNCRDSLGNPTYYRNVRERWLTYDNPASLDLFQTFHQWAEEIFADVYAALIGGPLLAIGAQDLANEHTGDFAAFINFSDKKHPTPVIRPLIYLKAICKMSDELRNNAALVPDIKTVVDGLIERWNKVVLDPRGLHYDPITGLFGNTWVDSFVAQFMDPHYDVLNPNMRVDKYIIIAMSAIKPLFVPLETGKRKWGWSDPLPSQGLDWSEINGAGGLDALAESFIKSLMNCEDTLEENVHELPAYPPAGDVVPDIPPLWFDWATTAKGYLKQNHLTVPPTIDKGPGIRAGGWGDMDPSANEQHRWIRVFGSGGWSTEGPCVSPGRP